MRILEDFLAQRRAGALRAAGTLPPADVQRLEDELAAMGAAGIRPVSECLSHGEARPSALAVLGRLLADATIEAYLELLASPNPAIVSGVTRVLIEGKGYDPRRILDALAAASPPRATLEPIVRAHAASIPVQELVTRLPEFAHDGQLLVLRALASVVTPQSAAHLVPLLKHDDPWLRLQVVKFLAEHPGPGVAAGLVDALGDTVKAVRFEAVTALHAHGGKDSVPALLRALEDPDLKVQSAAIDALCDLADVTAVPALVEVLANESEQVRRGAVEVLNQVATVDAIQDLVRALRDQDWWVRVRAADALGMLGGPNVVDAVVGLMGDADEALRRHAVEILNTVPDPAALPVLVTALDDADWWVRERAIDALGKLRDGRAVDPLLALIEREPAAAVLAVRALGAIGHPGALGPLAALLESPLPELRREVELALEGFARGSLAPDERRILERALAQAGSRAASPLETPAHAGADSGAGRMHSPNPFAARAERPTPTPAPRRDALGTLGLNFSDLPEGQGILERYRVVRRIGKGGFGTVYLVRDEMISEEIILKVLHAQLSMDENAVQRFVQELKIARRVSHRNVIRIHDFLDLGGTHAISMEYFAGRDLGGLLAEGGPLDPARALRIAGQVCDGLAAAHAEGVIHRDIKPANILIGDGDETRIVDFGLASAQAGNGVEARLTQSGLLIGSPEYMAPEQIMGDAVDHRVDLYSLGVVLYEALSGIRPFTAETPVKVLFQHLEGGATPLGQLVPGLDVAVETLVAHAMARDVNGRPASAAELRSSIDRALDALEATR